MQYMYVATVRTVILVMLDVPQTSIISRTGETKKRELLQAPFHALFTTGLVLDGPEMRSVGSEMDPAKAEVYVKCHFDPFGRPPDLNFSPFWTHQGEGAAPSTLFMCYSQLVWS